MISARKVLWIVLGITILAWTGTAVYLFWPVKKPLPSLPKIETPAPTQAPPVSKLKNLEDLAKDYLQAYQEPVADLEIRLFDLRKEEEYFSGHIRHASLILPQDLEGLAEEGRLTGKTVIVLANTGKTQTLTDLVEKIKENGAKEVYLFAEFNPDYFSQEIIEKVEAPPPPPS